MDAVGVAVEHVVNENRLVFFALDQLDQAMTVVKPANLAALISAALIIVVGLVWGIVGSIPDIVMGNGVIMNYDSVISVKRSNC